MIVSGLWFTGLVILVGAERLAELVVSRRNAAWSLARGGVEHGQGHFRFMVLLHSALLVAAVAETWLGQRPFIPLLGWSMLIMLCLTQALRWWCIATLRRQWNTRVIIVPGLTVVRRGPYRLLAHPNYVAVVIEGIALPLIHTAWITAVAFTVLNAVLLFVRIRVENAALTELRS